MSRTPLRFWAKSDPGEVKVLAELVRTDRHNLRQVASPLLADRGDRERRVHCEVTSRSVANKSRHTQSERWTNCLVKSLRPFTVSSAVTEQMVKHAQSSGWFNHSPRPASEYLNPMTNE